MAKQVRAARTRVQGGLLPTAPTERSQLVKHSIPEIASSAAGLDGLSEAFGRFFQATSGAINSVREGVLIAERQRIEQENEAQKRLAQGDALAGREMNPELTDDLDYYNTYRAILADRTGYDAVNDFQKWYMEDFLPANPQGDLVAARDEWVKANLTGAEDPEFEGAVLASFYKGSEQIVSRHTEDVVVRHINSGLRNLEAVISEDAKNGLVTPDRLAWYIQSARTIDPRNPHEAAPRIAAAIGTAIQNNPEKANAILSVLEAPGTGINDKSFAESFPDAFTKLQQDAVNSFTSINSIAELEAVAALEERVNQMHTMSDDELVELAADLVSAQWGIGAKSAVDGVFGRFQREMAKRNELLVKVAHVAHGIETGQVDVDVTRKHLGDYLRVQYGIEDIYEADPAFIAQIFVKAGLELPEDYRSRLSTSIINTQDPETAVKAYDILAGIEAARGRSAVHKVLDASAQRSYDEIARTMRSTNLPADIAIQRVADRRRTESDRKITWSDLTGKSNETEGREYADKIIKKQINAAVMGKSGVLGWFQTGATIAPGVMNDIREEVLASATEFTSSGASIDDAIKEAVERVSGRLEVIPKRDGRYYIQRDVEMPDVYLDGNGVVVPRVRLGRTIFNPSTGEQVDTLSVYEDDVKKLVGSARALIPDGDPDSLYLDQHESASIHGAYAVYEGGDAVVFRSGEEVTLGTVAEEAKPSFNIPSGYSRSPTGQTGESSQSITSHYPRSMESEAEVIPPSKITLPDSVEELNDMLEGFLGDTGFGFIEITTARGERGYMLAYRPHYGDQKGKSLAEREAEFTQPGTEQP